jgi:uncharacterized protein YycO
LNDVVPPRLVDWLFADIFLYIPTIIYCLQTYFNTDTIWKIEQIRRIATMKISKSFLTMGCMFALSSSLIFSHVFADGGVVVDPDEKKLIEQENAETLEFLRTADNKIDVAAVKEELKKQGVANVDQLPISEDGGHPNPIALAEGKGKIFKNKGQIGTAGNVLVTLDGSSSSSLIGHAGIVSDEVPEGKKENRNTLVVESFPKDKNHPDGVYHYRNNWAIRYKTVKGMHISGADTVAYRTAAQDARFQIGKPYNWNFLSKKRVDRFYCSQLVWRAWYNRGRDIDGDGGLIVTPNDIIKDNDTAAFYSQGF